MNLAEEFREIRRVCTPWCIVRTSDYRATIKTLLAVRINGEDPPPALMWTCTTGTKRLQGNVQSIAEPGEAPSEMLGKALDLPPETILFMVIPDDMSQQQNLWSNPFTVQAVAHLRDEFKSDRRTLVILSTDGKLPALISDDVPLIADPLPDREALVNIAQGIVKSTKRDIDQEQIGKAVSLCLGMNRFSAEEAIARKVRKNSIDLAGLAETQRESIEQSSERGLMFERGTETFDDIGGLDNIKTFSQLLFSGNRPPSVIVRLEEIEKALAGTGGDTSGVSQDQLGVLLTCMEDYDWSGLIAIGPPGSGKSLISKAMGNSNGAQTVNLDLGAMMGQYIGQSQNKIRKCMNILLSFAGKGGAFFVGTSNKLDIIKPELQRRFKFGNWFFDLPTADERKAIWNINLNKYQIPAQPLPVDTDWTGSDIRNVCDLADRLQCPLLKASTYIVPVAKKNPKMIELLRESASGCYLSATTEGTYQKPTRTGRALNIQ